MDVVPRRILEVVNELSPSERQWVGIRGIARRVPCALSVASYRIDRLATDGYLDVEKRGKHPIGVALTDKARDYLKSIGLPILSGQIADLI